jgi:hypothetical protein
VGLFKDLRKLNYVGREVNANWDVGVQLANAQQAMAQANAVRGVPVPVSVTEVVLMHHLAKAFTGAVLQVRVGDTPQDLSVDWDRS